jgi:hypothetical protein
MDAMDREPHGHVNLDGENTTMYSDFTPVESTAALGIGPFWQLSSGDTRWQ